MKQTILILLISTSVFFTACNLNNQTEKPASELLVDSTNDKLDKKYYQAFTDSLIDFDEQDLFISKKKFNDFKVNNVVLTDTNVYGASVSYRVSLPNNIITLAAFVDGNAYFVKSNVKDKPQLLISKNEINIKRGVDSFLTAFVNNKKFCLASETEYEVEGDKLIFTLFTKKGKFVAIETVDNYSNKAWENVMNTYNALANMLNKNYEKAISQQ